MFVPLLLFTTLLLSSAAGAVLGSRELENQVRAMMVDELDILRPVVEARSSQLRRDKVSATILTSTPEGGCWLEDETMVLDCYAFSVDFDKAPASVKITMRRNPKGTAERLIVTLYEVREDGSLKVLGRGALEGQEMSYIRRLRIAILQNAKDWFRVESGAGAPVERKVKVALLADGRPEPYGYFFDGPPELDYAYYEGPNSSKCDPSLECCLVSHYVNFTEIGWNKFIQYPAGFHANFCTGPSNPSCKHENPVVESILSTARSQSALPRKNFACAPHSFAPLHILYTVGENHSMKLILDDMIALSCSCMA